MFTEMHVEGLEATGQLVRPTQPRSIPWSSEIRKIHRAAGEVIIEDEHGYSQVLVDALHRPQFRRLPGELLFSSNEGFVLTRQTKQGGAIIELHPLPDREGAVLSLDWSNIGLPLTVLGLHRGFAVFADMHWNLFLWSSGEGHLAAERPLFDAEHLMGMVSTLFFMEGKCYFTTPNNISYFEVEHPASGLARGNAFTGSFQRDVEAILYVHGNLVCVSPDGLRVIDPVSLDQVKTYNKKLLSAGLLSNGSLVMEVDSMSDRHRKWLLAHPLTPESPQAEGDGIVALQPECAVLYTLEEEMLTAWDAVLMPKDGAELWRMELSEEQAKSMVAHRGLLFIVYENRLVVVGG